MPVPQPAPRVYEFGPYRLDPAARLFLREGQAVALHAKVFDTLVALVEHAGKPVDKDVLMRAVWPDTFVEESNLAHNVSVLRRTLGEAPGGRTWIETLPKRGYQFVGPLSVSWQESPDVPPRPVGAPLPTPRRRRLAAAAALAAALLAAAAWYLAPWRVRAPSPLKATFTQLTDQPGQELYPSLSPDGESLVYASLTSGNWDIWLQRVGSKAPVNLTKDSLYSDTQPAFSPDGEIIAFRSERDGGGIFLMGMMGESVRRLTDSGYHPAWSPDGKAIVCSTGRLGVQAPGRHSAARGKLFSVEVASGASRLIPGPQDALQPQWSPNGYRIAYWGGPMGDRSTVWTVLAAGGPPVRVTEGAWVDWNPLWNPDGNYLYFSSDRAGSMNLWRVRIREETGKILGPPEPVTTASPYAGYISLSRNGQRIAFVQVSRTINLQKVAFDPSRGVAINQPVPVTQGSREVNWPDASPHGEWLAFSSSRDQEDLYLIRTDGTGIRQLTSDIHKDRAPRWSPEGKPIAFYSDRSGKWEIWTINPDGSDLKQITWASSYLLLPIWSPTDNRLAYSMEGSSSFIVDPGRPWKEQTPEALPRLSDADTSFRAYSWSSDGRHLAGYEVKGVGVFPGITVYSLDSRKFDRLTDFGSYPRWLSDSRRLLFRHDDKLCLVDSRTKKVHEVLSVAPHLVGGGLVLSRDDRVIYFPLWATEADVWLMSMP